MWYFPVFLYKFSVNSNINDPKGVKYFAKTFVLYKNKWALILLQLWQLQFKQYFQLKIMLVTYQFGIFEKMELDSLIGNTNVL